MVGWERLQSRRVRAARLLPALALLAYPAFLATFPPPCRAQANYVARFSLEKDHFLLGEPVFCVFTLRNIGAQTFAFSYRPPSRVLNPELEQEPRFVVHHATGDPVPDPAPKPCSGARENAVYGYVTLPPGQTHSERWLLNQWAQISRPGRHRVRAERRLPLLGLEPGTLGLGSRPVAFAMAINEMEFEAVPSSAAELEARFLPFLRALNERSGANLSEAVLVVTTLPHPFLLPKLELMANAPAHEQRWDRRRALEGLARLGSPTAWEAISRIAAGRGTPRSSLDDSVRSYAVLLLGQKADPAFLPTLLELAATAPEGLRGDALRALGLFHAPRANQVLFEKLRSASPTDRSNAILGLKDLETKDAIPALLAMLNDREPQVRQVAHFALQSLTGMKLKLPPNASGPEFARVARQWRAWWQEKGATFVPVHLPPCRDW